MSRRRIKRKYIVSILWIVIPVTVVLVIMNNSYSLWSTKLTVQGTATAQRRENVLAVNPVLISSGKYTNIRGVNGIFSDYATWQGDRLDGNSLSTTIHDTRYATWFNGNLDITITFTLKNESSEGVTYRNGSAHLDTIVDHGNALSNYSCTTQRQTLESGQTTRITVNTDVNRYRIQNGTYLKFAIVYYVTNDMGTEVPYYFYYTVYFTA